VNRVEKVYIDLPSLREGAAGGYFLALIAVSIAAVLKAALGPESGPAICVTYCPAIFATSLIAGYRAGLLSLALSALAVDYLEIPPIGSLRVARWEDVIGLMDFVALLAPMVFLAGAWRRSIFAYRELGQELERCVERLAILEFALNQVHEAAFLVDKDSRFMYVNDEATRSLGYSREELLRMCVADVDPDFPPARWPSYWSELTQKGSFSFETRHKTEDGHIFPVEITSNYFEYGGRAYNTGLARDITHRKQLEQERLGHLQEITQCRRLCGADNAALRVRRNGPDGPHLQMRRRAVRDAAALAHSADAMCEYAVLAWPDAAHFWKPVYPGQNRTYGAENRGQRLFESGGASFRRRPPSPAVSHSFSTHQLRPAARYLSRWMVKAPAPASLMPPRHFLPSFLWRHLRCDRKEDGSV
jgi:PAS domain S-box-containing protein